MMSSFFYMEDLAGVAVLGETERTRDAARDRSVGFLGKIRRGKMKSLDQSQTPTPAEVYESCFVPAFFERWGPVVSAAASITSGQSALDVACGTGALTRAVVERVGPKGSVVGLDPNPEMLAVARRQVPDAQWREGRAESLPFPGDSFDAVVSQFGFMFFEDQPKALREMMRVLRPGGRLAVAVCDALDHSPGYAVLAELLHRLFGEAVAESFRAPFRLGDRERLLDLSRRSGIGQVEVSRHEGEVRFDSVESLVFTERACVWTLGGLLDDEQFATLLKSAEESLRPFIQSDGAVSLLMPALILTATKK